MLQLHLTWDIVIMSLNRTILSDSEMARCIKLRDTCFILIISTQQHSQSNRDVRTHYGILLILAVSALPANIPQATYTNTTSTANAAPIWTIPPSDPSELDTPTPKTFKEVIAQKFASLVPGKGTYRTAQVKKHALAGKRKFLLRLLRIGRLGESPIASLKNLFMWM